MKACYAKGYAGGGKVPGKVMGGSTGTVLGTRQPPRHHGAAPGSLMMPAKC